MPIDFRHQFRLDTGQEQIAFDNQIMASQRVASIYQTARKGRLGRDKAMDLWNNYFAEIWNEAEQIPANRGQFETWIRQEIRALSEQLGTNSNLKLGLAQKFLNLFLKDLWAFNAVPDKISDLFHIPLDRNLLGCFSGYSENWKSWTLVVANNDERFNCLYLEYCDIQIAFRRYAGQMKGFSILDLEQLFWHEIAVKPGT